ncbi:GreA/GreB family elongation factor [Vibrio sinaloensis]|nr:GreA/GreB family elongation factor [Vibrio sinaloensis]
MNKLELKQIILDLLEKKRQVAQSSVQRAIESATDEETVPEHKYDTLALEAAYLAHGQAMRLQECEQEIRQITDLELPVAPSNVVMGSLVYVSDLDEVEHCYFMAPCSGGLKVTFGETEVTLVTFESPLGRALKGRMSGDEAEYKVADTMFSYQIETIS